MKQTQNTTGIENFDWNSIMLECPKYSKKVKKELLKNDELYQKLLNGDYLKNISLKKGVENYLKVVNVSLNPNDKSIVLHLENDFNYTLKQGDKDYDLFLSYMGIQSFEDFVTNILEKLSSEEDDDVDFRIDFFKKLRSLFCLIKQTKNEMVVSLRDGFKYQILKKLNSNDKKEDVVVERIKIKNYNEKERLYYGETENGVSVIIPLNEVAVNLVDFERAPKLVGEVSNFGLLGFDPNLKRFVFSFKKYWNAYKKEVIEYYKELIKNNPSKKFKAVVTGVGKNGVFIDVENCLTGLLHFSKLDEETLNKVKLKNLKINDEIDVIIDEIYDNGTISAHMEKSQNWSELIGQRFSGKVVKKKEDSILVLLNINGVEQVAGLYAQKENEKELVKSLEIGSSYDGFIIKSIFEKNGKTTIVLTI